MKKISIRIGYHAILDVFLAMILMAVSQAAFSAGNTNPGIVPSNAKPYGMTYGEWSAKWWQWNLSLPVDQNPSYDEGGSCSNGANGQLGPVWFLTGVNVSSGTAVRNCIIPAGKALFFPIINTECSTLEEPPFYGSNEEELRDCAKSFNVSDVYAEIDGIAVQNLDNYLVESPLYTFAVPPNNIWGLPAGTGQSVSNGYFLMHTPLSIGEHTIHFGGTYIEYGFTLDITYHLTVTPPRRQ
jgi:hypothetical protein